jgi:2'-5' RNA ligase
VTALIVPVELPSRIEKFRRLHVPTAERGLRAHVTLLYPFAPLHAIDEDLRSKSDEVVSRHKPFAFRLPAVGRWPGSTHLTVDPPEPFSELVEDLARAFPAYPPYAGEFPFVPHLSLAEDDPAIDLAEIQADLDRLAREVLAAAEVALIAEADEVWVGLADFALLGR